MGRRSDYEERREKRIEKYNKLSKKAKEKSIKHNDIEKSIDLDNKSNYFANKAKSMQNNKVIYNDDPNAIIKLKEKLKRLENEKNSIKARTHEKWELTNIGANIRETKLRIKRLEEQETLVFPETKFKGGKAIHNKEINRIQLLFDNIPSFEIRNELKHNGFHWSKKEGAWQREFNKKTIDVTNYLVKSVFNIKDNEEEFE